MYEGRLVNSRFLGSKIGRFLRKLRTAHHAFFSFASKIAIIIHSTCD